MGKGTNRDLCHHVSPTQDNSNHPLFDRLTCVRNFAGIQRVPMPVETICCSRNCTRLRHEMRSCTSGECKGIQDFLKMVQLVSTMVQIPKRYGVIFSCRSLDHCAEHHRYLSLRRRARRKSRMTSHVFLNCESSHKADLNQILPRDHLQIVGCHSSKRQHSS